MLIAPYVVSVPGRVNLIGEHIDYHNLPVLPMAIQRRISIAFRPRGDHRIRAASSGTYGTREFALVPHLECGPPGDWANYLKAAAQAAGSRWNLTHGIDATIASDLPAAAGLSSSSALLAAFTIALLKANDIHTNVDQLMQILPDAEHFVGTRGGGMDHAAVLAGRPGCALLVSFAPLELSPIPIPLHWSFLIAHSLTTAEKSGAARSKYNALRAAGTCALHDLGLSSYATALETDAASSISKIRGEPERMAFLHVTSEAIRVRQAVEALRRTDFAAFGRVLNASHTSLRDRLKVSSPAIDSLVNAALESGAAGARLTGGGFGGCVIILCKAAEREQIRAELVNRYYAKHSNFDPQEHLFFAEPSAGGLID